MKRISTILLSLAVLALAGCDSVDENNRFDYVPPKTVARAVLIEDFTGQNCINCPKAHEEIEKLQTQYGAANVIAVAIHGGNFAVRPNKKKGIIGLRTKLGDEYVKAWKVQNFPMGMVDRSSGVVNFDKWAGLVNSDLGKTSPLSLSLSITGDAVSGFKANVSALSTENLSGKIQLWIVEDGIVCKQLMPNGDENNNYVQNNVLRAAVNGMWGTDIAFTAAQTATEAFPFTVKDDWKVENLSVVAFVYNDKDGVIQVTRQKVTK